MKKQDKRIVIFAAGTGGHVYPGLSIANMLLSENISVSWVGTKNGIENKIITDSKIKIHHIDFSGIRGKGVVSYIKLPVKLFIATIQSISILRKIKPDTALSMGGYISFPCALASFILRIPIITHEQNIVFGLTNNVLRFLSDVVILGFPMNIKNKKYKFLGNPSRYEKSKIKKINKKNTKINILIVGGSLGAQVFNEIVPQAIYGLSKIKNYDISVIHQTGKTYKTAEMQYNKINVNVDLREYIGSMKKAYEWCDIILCRGGAITITEIMNLGIPAIIIPYPYAVDDHQMKNSKYLEENDAAIVINQNNFTPDYLINIFKSLIDNVKVRECLSSNIRVLNKNDSTKNICEEIIKKISDN